MKRCPSCNRTFDDAQSFCLEDATPLISEASPYDPAKTLLATGPSAMNNTQPPQTPSAAAPPSYQQPYQQQWTPQQQWGAPPASRNTNKIIILAVVGLVVAAAIGLTIYFLARSGSTASKRFVGTWVEEERPSSKGARFTEDGKIMVPHPPVNTMSATPRPSGDNEELAGTYTVNSDKATIIIRGETITGTLESDNRMRLESQGKTIYLMRK